MRLHSVRTFDEVCNGLIKHNGGDKILQLFFQNTCKSVPIRLKCKFLTCDCYLFYLTEMRELHVLNENFEIM